MRAADPRRARSRTTGFLGEAAPVIYRIWVDFGDHRTLRVLARPEADACPSTTSQTRPRWLEENASDRAAWLLTGAQWHRCQRRPCLLEVSMTYPRRSRGLQPVRSQFLPRANVQGPAFEVDPSRAGDGQFPPAKITFHPSSCVKRRAAWTPSPNGRLHSLSRAMAAPPAAAATRPSRSDAPEPNASRSI